ncbi:MAG: pyruvate:ferredoxin (flavodoxin) oxidoreductase [Planctomycetes bacterium]|nr:pyruvate:ferredoxin (flavodoxin) oxidoreductase [Planctomycetota bacterium]MCB9920494.1 pyruvate:ferredoxin (flavodoxin) oxidoreductase [Planctomycetota bacterium]
MSELRRIMVDGNEAVALVAHKCSEVLAIYPITPSSAMGEHADLWSAKGQKNLWGTVPDVVEMQSEGGAAGALHGSLQAGAITSSFTASQGLLLKIPNLYKIAGELTPFVLHVAARTLATHALSIFGDHSDVMACRQTGMAMLCAGSVQEAHDFALISLAASLRTRLPFLHFFDGFRTSHEVAKITAIPDDVMLAMLPDALLHDHRVRALDPDRPVIRGTAQNPDTFFQAREAANGYYDRCPAETEAVMGEFERLTGRSYSLCDYEGHPEAERVIVLMGSGAETASETVQQLAAQGERVGVVKVRLYRPFPSEQLLRALPNTTRSIAVLDRTKEPGAQADPLLLDVRSALVDAEQEERLPFKQRPRVVGGRYGLASKEFTPGMVAAVFEELKAERPKSRFTIGIVDDVTHHSLAWTEVPERAKGVRAIFFGLGSDGTVGANKNSIKIIGEDTKLEAQGYFVYDSKKSGAMTISHLRFGPERIRSSYLIQSASFVACHQWAFLDKIDMLEKAERGATFLVNSPFGPDEVWDRLTREVQQDILDKGIRLYVIDAVKVARDAGMGNRINTVMQTCFFAISGVLPRFDAIEAIKASIRKTYGRRGQEVVKRNFDAVDASIDHLYEVTIPQTVTATRTRPPIVSDEAPDHIRRVAAVMLAGKGDALPVSAFPVDGTWPLSSSRWEKRRIAHEVPVWSPDVCIQCNQCAFVCPHATIRAKVYDESALASAPADFLHVDYKAKDFRGSQYTIQVAPEDCTGCGLCVEICPAKDKTNPRHKAINMTPVADVLEVERQRWDFFTGLPEKDLSEIERIDAKSTQLLQPLFEFSGACAGCGETPYVKLMTQLFGDRALIANATGCSSIYGGNLPTTPYCTDDNGRGPAWANSLFEDNAEFGLGFRLALDKHRQQALELLSVHRALVGDELFDAIEHCNQTTREGILEMRRHVAQLLERLAGHPEAARLAEFASHLVQKSVWLVGGDGWAYDIGYGGLDHVLSMDRNINVLVLDTEVYSNTGGQSSKATPLGASAKFAISGRSIGKKDLALEAMSYGHVYVARVAFGANYNQTVKAFVEAESYPGPSLILAYSPCIAHGYDLRFGVEQTKLAVETGYWPLFRYDPRRAATGAPGLELDSREPKKELAAFMNNETRFRMVERMDPERYRRLQKQAQVEADRRFSLYQQLAEIKIPVGQSSEGGEA